MSDEEDDDDDIQPADREAFHALVDADDRQCNNAFRLLFRVERRTAVLLGLEEDLGVHAELRAAVAVAIHEVLVEIETRIVHAIKASTSIRQAN